MAAASVLVLCGAGPISWKVYNVNTKAPDNQVFLYEMGTMKKLPSGPISVWTETLSVDAMLKHPLSPEAVAQVKASVRAGYRPPFTKISPAAGADDGLGVAEMEAIANAGGTTPGTQSLWEVDCAGDVQRILSASEFSGPGKVEHYDAVGDWTHFAPGSMGDSLSRLVCP